MASNPVIKPTIPETQWVDDTTQWVDDNPRFAEQAPSLYSKPSLMGDVGKVATQSLEPGAEWLGGSLLGGAEAVGGLIAAVPGAAYNFAGLATMNPRFMIAEVQRQKEAYDQAQAATQKAAMKSSFAGKLQPTAAAIDAYLGMVPVIGEQLQGTFGTVPGEVLNMFTAPTAYEKGKAFGHVGGMVYGPKILGKAAGEIGRQFFSPEASYRKFRSNMDTALAHANDLGGGPTLPGGEIYHHRTMNAVAPYLKQWLDEKASGVKKFNTESLVQAADYIKKNFWDRWRSNVGAPLGGVNIPTAAIKQAVIDRMPNVWRTVEGGNKIGQVQAALDSLLPEENITLQELMDKKSYLNHEMGMHQKRMFPEVKPNAASKADLLNTDPKAYVLDQLAEQMRQAADQTVTNQLNLPEGVHRNLMRDAEAIHDFSDKAYNLNQTWAPVRNLKGATPAAVKGAQVAATYELGIISPAKSAVHRTLNYITPGMKNTPDNFVDFGLKHLRKASNVGPVREMLTQQGPPQLPPAEFPPMGGVTPGEQLATGFRNVANEPGRTGPGNYPLLPPPPGEYPGVGVGEGTILGGTAAIPEQAIPGTTAVDVNPPNPVTTIRSNNQIVDQYMRPAKPREQVYPPWVEGEGEFVDPERLPPPEGKPLMAPVPGETDIPLGPPLKGNNPRNKIGNKLVSLETPVGEHFVSHNPTTGVTYIGVPGQVLSEAGRRGLLWGGSYGSPTGLTNNPLHLSALEDIGTSSGNIHIQNTAKFIREQLKAAAARGEKNVMIGSGESVLNHELNHHLTNILKSPYTNSLFSGPVEATEFYNSVTSPPEFKGIGTKELFLHNQKGTATPEMINELNRRISMIQGMSKHFTKSPTYKNFPDALNVEAPAFLAEGAPGKLGLSTADAGKILHALYEKVTYDPSLDPAASRLWLLSHGPYAVDLINQTGSLLGETPLQGTPWNWVPETEYGWLKQNERFSNLPGEGEYIPR